MERGGGTLRIPGGRRLPPRRHAAHGLRGPRPVPCLPPQPRGDLCRAAVGGDQQQQRHRRAAAGGGGVVLRDSRARAVRRARTVRRFDRPRHLAAGIPAGLARGLRSGRRPGGRGGVPPRRPGFGLALPPDRALPARRPGRRRAHPLRPGGDARVAGALARRSRRARLRHRRFRSPGPRRIRLRAQRAGSGMGGNGGLDTAAGAAFQRRLRTPACAPAARGVARAAAVRRHGPGGTGLDRCRGGGAGRLFRGRRHRPPRFASRLGRGGGAARGPRLPGFPGGRRGGVPLRRRACRPPPRRPRGHRGGRRGLGRDRAGARGFRRPRRAGAGWWLAQARRRRMAPALRPRGHGDRTDGAARRRQFGAASGDRVAARRRRRRRARGGRAGDGDRRGRFRASRGGGGPACRGDPGGRQRRAGRGAVPAGWR